MTSPFHPLADPNAIEEAVEQQDGGLSQSPVIQSAVIPASGAQSLVQSPLWTEDENDDLYLAKHSTWTMDGEMRAALEVPPLPATPKYVQGVVQGKQVYLVTNLLDNRTQTLFQPQLVWTIGRNRSAAFPLHDRQLSRRHAVILYAPFEGFCLLDLNSMNGSYINGQRVQQRQRLQDGDWVCVGSTQFFFFVSGQDKKLDRLHPEVLMRLSKVGIRTTPSPDSPKLNQAISFKTLQSD